MIQEIILTFDEVSTPASAPDEIPLVDVTFSLGAGDLAIVDTATRGGSCSLAEIATGLTEPTQGSVTFLGEDWQELKPPRAAALRGRIGRVFTRQSWISNLDVDENVTLAQRYHTGRSHRQVLAEAETLAQTFGLPGLPAVRPARAGRQELRLAEWVRAFLGTPRLIILEEPMRGVASGLFAHLIQTVEAARERGAAVLYLTGDSPERDLATPHATIRLTRRESTVLKLEETSAWPSP